MFSSIGISKLSLPALQVLAGYNTYGLWQFLFDYVLNNELLNNKQVEQDAVEQESSSTGEPALFCDASVKQILHHSSSQKMNFSEPPLTAIM